MRQILFDKALTLFVDDKIHLYQSLLLLYFPVAGKSQEQGLNRAIASSCIYILQECPHEIGFAFLIKNP